MSQDQSKQPEESETARLAQIRELLFGEEARSSKQRLEHTESKLADELSRLGQRLDARLAELDERSRDERAGLADTIEAHRGRAETVEHETGESLSALGRSIERLGERHTQQLRELREALERQLHELGQRLERSIAVLDARKTDREVLGRLLGEVAKGLIGEPELKAHANANNRSNSQPKQREADARQ